MRAWSFPGSNIVSSLPPSSVGRSLAKLPLAGHSGVLVLGAIFALLVLAGSHSVWIVFPMTAPIGAGEVTLYGLAGSTLITACLALAVLAAWFSPGLACALLLAMVALLLRVPLEAATSHPDWLQAYLVQTSDRFELGQFLASHYTLNLSPEPALVPVDNLEGTDDQLRLGWTMLARPWYLTLGACMSLLFVVASRWRAAHRAAWLGGVAALLAATLLLPPLWGMERAQARRDAGDRALAAGDGPAALAAYHAALTANPGLVAARPFWNRVAMANAQASGGRHVYAELVRPFSLMMKRTQQQDPSVYATAAENIAALALPEPSDRLEAGLQQAVVALRSDLLVQQALLLHEGGELPAALSVLQRVNPPPTRAARFYLADMTMRQGGWLQAAEMLRDLDAQVAHVTVRADIACTLGDALTGAGRIVEARAAYLVCRDLDELTNYRLSKALGGT